MTEPRLNFTREHGNWFLHHNDEFVGDVLIRHKEEDHLEVRIPFEALKELVAEATRKACLDRIYDAPNLSDVDREEMANRIRGFTVNQLLSLE